MHDDEIGGVGEQLVLQRQRKARPGFRGLDALGSRYPCESFAWFDGGGQNRARYQRLAAIGGHEVERHLTGGRGGKARENVNRLAAEQPTRRGGDPRRLRRPSHVGMVHARTPQPGEHAQDASLGILAGCDELTCATRRFGELTQDAFGRCRPDADGEHPLPRLARRGHQRIGFPDFAIGDEEHIRCAFSAAQCEDRTQRGFHFSAAQIRGHRRQVLRGTFGRPLASPPSTCRNRDAPCCRIGTA